MNSRITLLLFFLFTFVTNISNGQETQLSQDSLKTLYDLTFDHAYAYDYTSAIEVSGLLIKKAQKQEDNHYLSKGYSRLGSIHNALNDTIKSKDYYNKALHYAKLTKSDTFISGIYNDIGNMYADNGGNVDMAIDYYKKSIALNKNDNAPEIASLAAIMNIGWTYLDQEQLDSAFIYLSKSKKLLQDTEKHPLYYINLDNLYGRYYYEKNDFEKAIPILLKNAKSADDGNYLDAASTANLYLSKSYEKQGNLTAALVRFRKHKALDDSLSAINREHSLLEASARFNLEQYQNDLDVAETEQAYADALYEKKSQQNTFFIILSCLLLCGLATVLLGFRNRKKYITRLNEKNQELISAKNKAEHLSKSKAKFFSTVSHELRTPLYGVIGLSSILLEDKNLTSHQDDLQSLKFSADYLLALINDVLTLNKIDANGIKVERAPFSLEKLIQSISKSFAYSLEQNNNTLEISIDEKLPAYLLGDSVKLSQILMNLVGNAVKFNENGTITLAIKLLHRNKEGVYSTQFIIKDDGIGIPREKQDLIFEEFLQIENKNYNYQGTGLGLPIVKKLLDVYNSEIHLKSEPGKGAEFSFIIDLHEDISQLSITYENINCPVEPVTENTFNNLKVLIVDDNKINQKVTKKILEKRHIHCSLADDGQQAINSVSEQEFDLILMDVNMPNVNGIQATQAIRKFNTHTPIVALTAVEVQEMRAKIMDSGMNDIILKPYDISQFLTTILRHIGVSAAKIPH